MRQAITTKYYPNTDTIKASTDATSVKIAYDYSHPHPHSKAAMALIKKLGWDKDCYTSKGEWHGGDIENGYVFVFVNELSKIQGA